MSDKVSKLKHYMGELSSYAMLIVGAAIAAFSIEEFLVPCTILDGGIVGISIMINNLSGIPLGQTVICRVSTVRLARSRECPQGGRPSFSAAESAERGTGPLRYSSPRFAA